MSSPERTNYLFDIITTSLNDCCSTTQYTGH